MSSRTRRPAILLSILNTLQRLHFHPQACCFMVPKQGPCYKHHKHIRKEEATRVARVFLSWLSLFIREENLPRKLSPDTFTCVFLAELGHMAVPGCKGVWESMHLVLPASTVAGEPCHTAGKAGGTALGPADAHAYMVGYTVHSTSCPDHPGERYVAADKTVWCGIHKGVWDRDLNRDLLHRKTLRNTCWNIPGVL